MKKTTKQWLPYADADMVAAKALLAQRKNRWTNILLLWHCQQAIEKLFKAVMVEKDREVLKIHNLRRLRELAEVELSEKHFNLIISLNKYYLRSRYPDLLNKPLPAPTNKVAKKLYIQVNDLYLWLIKYLKNL